MHVFRNTNNAVKAVHQILRIVRYSELFLSWFSHGVLENQDTVSSAIHGQTLMEITMTSNQKVSRMIIMLSMNFLVYVIYDLLQTGICRLSTVWLSACINKHNSSQQTQNICTTFIQRRPNVFDVCLTLYKCYTNVSCLLGLSPAESNWFELFKLPRRIYAHAWHMLNTIQLNIV